MGFSHVTYPSYIVVHLSISKLVLDITQYTAVSFLYTYICTATCSTMISSVPLLG